MQTATTNLNINIENIWEKRPFIISGPCSAETPEQILETAKLLAASGNVDMFRAEFGNQEPSPVCLKVLEQML